MNEIEEIKSRTDIVELIGGYVQLKKAGRNHKGLCPFHNEKTPSFMVSQEKQIWRCFGACGEGGDAFSFLQKIESLSFGEAVGRLAEKTGVKVTNRVIKTDSAKKSLYSANEIAGEYFVQGLHTQEGKKANNYLLKVRKITARTIRDFAIGYAPKGKDGLLMELQKHGIDSKDALLAGLAKDKNGQILDFFWQRLIFPIKNHSGQIVGFSARALDDSLPKYINTPETPIYSKSGTLYGIDLAKESIRKQDYAILVEGMMDVIASHQAGVKNVVATGGTALTEGQLSLIQRFTKNIKLAFDFDFAGNEATRRAIEIAWKMGFNIKVITISHGKDPGDIAIKKPESWKGAIKEAKYVVDYLFEESLKKYNKKDAIGRKHIAKNLLPVIRRIPDEIEKDTYIKRLANELLVGESSILAALKNISLPKEQRTQSVPKKEIINQVEELEKNVLGLLAGLPNYLDFSDSILKESDFHNKKAGNFFKKMIKYNDQKKSFTESGFLAFLKDEEVEDFKHYILSAEVMFSDFNEEKKAEEIYFGVKRIKKNSLARKKDALSQKIRELEKSKNKKETDLALQELNNVLAEEQRIS